RSPPRLEIRHVRRKIEPVIADHQVLDAVEIAAEGIVVDALVAIAALPVQVDRDEPGALLPANGNIAKRPGIGLKRLLLLRAPWRQIDKIPLHAPLGDLV